jgi:multiple sugar transport system substrate-binding protein
VRDVSQYRDIYGVALANIVAGADARTELEKATREFEPIFQKGLRI